MSGIEASLEDEVIPSAGVPRRCRSIEAKLAALAPGRRRITRIGISPRG
jgi:hypothetical protein